MLLQPGSPALVDPQHRQALAVAVVVHREVRGLGLDQRGDQDAGEALHRIQLIGAVLGDLHARAVAVVVHGVDAHHVVRRDLHHHHEVPRLRIRFLLAHIERHEYGAAVRGDRVVGVGVAVAVLELVQDEVLHALEGAATICLTLLKPRAVHDEHVLRGRHPETPGRKPSLLIDAWQLERTHEVRAALEDLRRGRLAIRRLQRGHSGVEGPLAAIRPIERPAACHRLVLLAERLLGSAGAGGGEIAGEDGSAILGSGHRAKLAPGGGLQQGQHDAKRPGADKPRGHARPKRRTVKTVSSQAALLASSASRAA